jgi:short-subunit dehydrogenase
MKRIVDWLDDRLQDRPWWMNLLMLVSGFLAYVYVPWDFFFKPVALDQEAWFGILLTGWAAKLTEPLHFFVYAAGAYGFWRMRPWMWPWAAAWTAQLAFGMLVWPIVYRGGVGGWVLGLAGGAVFGGIAWALYNAREDFAAKPLGLRDRYGDWALVTGASSGIGADFARALAREGMSCILTARREDRLRALAAELEASYGVSSRVVAADLATVSGQRRVLEEVADLPIGLLVNNAGFGLAGRLDKQDPDKLRQMIELNCQAPVALTRALVPGMVQRARGAVIVVSSVAGRQAMPLFGVYAATKGFDLLFGEALWSELREHNVDVTVLMPGPVATEFETVAGEHRPHPEADEPADVCVRYALEALGKQPSVVSGGWPNWLRANLNRFAPRSVVTLIAAHLYEQQTPKDLR